MTKIQPSPRLQRGFLNPKVFNLLVSFPYRSFTD